MTHTPDEIIAKLGELSSDEIARLLRDSGIHAARSIARSCAISAYVHEETGTTIVTGRTTWSRTSWGIPPCTLDGPLPPSVSSFVYKFDSDFYPDLIDPEVERKAYGLDAPRLISGPTEEYYEVMKGLRAADD
jgi:hypothetical protein